MGDVSYSDRDADIACTIARLSVRLSDIERDALARGVTGKNLTIAQVIHRTLRTAAEPDKDSVRLSQEMPERRDGRVREQHDYNTQTRQNRKLPAHMPIYVDGGSTGIVRSH